MKTFKNHRLVLLTKHLLNNKRACTIAGMNFRLMVITKPSDSDDYRQNPYASNNFTFAIRKLSDNKLEQWELRFRLIRNRAQIGGWIPIEFTTTYGVRVTVYGDVKDLIASGPQGVFEDVMERDFTTLAMFAHEWGGEGVIDQ